MKQFSVLYEILNKKNLYITGLTQYLFYYVINEYHIHLLKTRGTVICGLLTADTYTVRFIFDLVFAQIKVKTKSKNFNFLIGQVWLITVKYYLSLENTQYNT